MNPYYKKVTIEPNRYCNPNELEGYEEVDEIYSNKTAFYPYHDNHNKLLYKLDNTLSHLNENKIIAGYNHFKLPYSRLDIINQDFYEKENTWKPLQTTLVSYWLAKKDFINTSKSHFYIKDGIIKPLTDYTRSYKDKTLISNGGFFVTKNLIYSGNNSKKWALHNRYIDQEHQLSQDLSPFYGFYYVEDDHGNIYSTFNDSMGKGYIGIKKDGYTNLLTDLEISSYELRITGDKLMKIRAINNANSNLPVSIFNSNFTTEKTLELRRKIKNSFWYDTSWQNYKEIIKNDRYNIFITNRGEGDHPAEYIELGFDGYFPVFNFGYIISFDKTFFKENFGEFEDFINKNKGHKIQVIPQSSRINFGEYKQIYSTSVPIISDYKNRFSSELAEEVMEQLDEMNFTHPSFQLSQESFALSPIIRNPSNILIETESGIGSIIFTGRYEMSIGACLLDEINLINILNQKNVFGEPIKNAIKLDGGSGAKVIFLQNQELFPLNIPAPGIRNDLGDANSNFYHGLILELK